ncbi:hypothetical protein ACLMJK_003835 [Lecanora helva]
MAAQLPPLPAPPVKSSSPSKASTRVGIWLEEQPSPPSLLRPHEVHEQGRKRKRQKRVEDCCAKRPQRKSQCLMETSNNIARGSDRPSDRKLRSSKTGKHPTTPTHGRGANRPQAFTEQDNVRHGDGSPQKIDPDPTPRPIPRSRGRLPPGPKFDPAEQDVSSGSSRSFEHKSRTLSPTKTLGDLQYAEIPVDPRDWSAAMIPQELKPLVADMERIRTYIGIIPIAVRDKFAQVQESVYDFQCVEDWDNQESQDMSKNKGVTAKLQKEATDRVTGGLGHDLFWYEVNKIRKAHTRCRVGTKPEPAWNCEVHARLLYLALDGYWENKEIWYEDITQARIADKSLVPWNISSGAMQSKMVDYAIVISPSQDFTSEASQSLHNHVVEKLRRQDSSMKGINQTNAEWARHKPIGVNIETKKGAIGEVEGHVQIGTWITAQYNRLRQLCEEGTPLPSFPVLFVQGSRWTLMITCMRENSRIDLIRELPIGDTGTVVGVYQLIAAIRRLAQWVYSDYRPWFERHVLGIKGGLHS